VEALLGGGRKYTMWKTMYRGKPRLLNGKYLMLFTTFELAQEELDRVSRQSHRAKNKLTIEQVDTRVLSLDHCSIDRCFPAKPDA
jgi:hypothetical protein